MTAVEAIFWSLYALGTAAMWGFFVIAVYLGTKDRRPWAEGPGPDRRQAGEREPWYEEECKRRGRQAKGLR